MSSKEILSKILTKREFEVASLLIKGYRTKDISNQLFIKSNTVSTLKKTIFIKTKVKSIIDLYKIFNE
jgi:DNA-binding CsgD family transcriptional regulator